MLPSQAETEPGPEVGQVVQARPRPGRGPKMLPTPIRKARAAAHSTMQNYKFHFSFRFDCTALFPCCQYEIVTLITFLLFPAAALRFRRIPPGRRFSNSGRLPLPPVVSTYIPYRQRRGRMGEIFIFFSVSPKESSQMGENQFFLEFSPILQQNQKDSRCLSRVFRCFFIFFAVFTYPDSRKAEDQHDARLCPSSPGRPRPAQLLPCHVLAPSSIPSHPPVCALVRLRPQRQT